MYKIPIKSDNSSYGILGNTMIVTGEFSTVGNQSGVTESVAVTFPKAFSSTPIVIPTPESAAPYSRARNITVADKSTTGFTAYVMRMDNNPETINYIAIGEIIE